MDEQKNISHSPTDDDEPTPKPAEGTAPPANPETDAESVEKGEEQLGRVSGN